MNKTCVLYDKNAFCHIICMHAKTICKHYYLFAVKLVLFLDGTLLLIVTSLVCLLTTTTVLLHRLKYWNTILTLKR